MLSIRLSRTGKKKQPHYRIIVIDKQRDPWGKSLEILGSRNPRSKEMTLKEDRVKYWLEKGAQPSNSVWNLLVEAGIVKGDKRGVTHISKKRKNRAAEAEAEAKEKEAPPADEANPEETTTEAPAEEKKEEAPAEEPKEEAKKEEAPAEEPKEEEAKAE